MCSSRKERCHISHGKALLNRMSSYMSASISSLILKAKNDKKKVMLLINSLEVYAVSLNRKKMQNPITQTLIYTVG